MIKIRTSPGEIIVCPTGDLDLAAVRTFPLPDWQTSSTWAHGHHRPLAHPFYRCGGSKRHLCFGSPGTGRRKARHSSPMPAPVSGGF